MSALGARLRRVSGVDEGNANANCFSLVDDEGAKLGKTPTMQSPPVPLSAGLRLLADAGQVFQYNGCTRRNDVHNAAGDDVVAVAAETGLLATEDLQPAFSRFGPFGLALPLLPKQLCFNVLPSFLSEESPFAGNSRAVDAKIDANHGIIRLNDWRLGLDDDMKEKASVSMNEVGSTDLAGGRPSERRRQMKWSGDSSGSRRHFDRMACPINLERVDVVAWRTRTRMRAGCRAPLIAAGEHRLDRLRRFDAGLNVQVAYKAWQLGFERLVCQVMQLDTVFLIGIPRRFAHGVESGGELTRRFKHRRHLFGGRRQE